MHGHRKTNMFLCEDTALFLKKVIYFLKEKDNTDCVHGPCLKFYPANAKSIFDNPIEMPPKC